MVRQKITSLRSIVEIHVRQLDTEVWRLGGNFFDLCMTSANQDFTMKLFIIKGAA